MVEEDIAGAADLCAKIKTNSNQILYRKTETTRQTRQTRHHDFYNSLVTTFVALFR